LTTHHQWSADPSRGSTFSYRCSALAATSQLAIRNNRFEFGVLSIFLSSTREEHITTVGLCRLALDYIKLGRRSQGGPNIWSDLHIQVIASYTPRRPLTLPSLYPLLRKDGLAIAYLAMQMIWYNWSPDPVTNSIIDYVELVSNPGIVAR